MPSDRRDHKVRLSLATAAKATTTDVSKDTVHRGKSNRAAEGLSARAMLPHLADQPLPLVSRRWALIYRVRTAR